MGGLWGTVTGGLDHLAGSTDEAVGGATDDALSGDWAGVGDNLAGSVDEATGEATDAVADGDVLGVGDALLGSADEGTAGFLDWAAGSSDEAVARQFDGTEGGGIFDEWGQTAENVGSDLMGHTSGVLFGNPLMVVLGLVALYVAVTAYSGSTPGGGA